MIDQRTSTTILACTAGMLAGSLVDSYDGRVAMFAAFCIVGDRSLIYSLCLHWRELPATYAGMLIGGMLVAGHSAAVRRRQAHRWIAALRAVVCYGSMLAGMEAGMLAIGSFYSSPQSSAVMLATMVFGMTGGVLLAEILFVPQPGHR